MFSDLSEIEGFSSSFTSHQRKSSKIRDIQFDYKTFSPGLQCYVKLIMCNIYFINKHDYSNIRNTLHIFIQLNCKVTKCFLNKDTQTMNENVSIIKRARLDYLRIFFARYRIMRLGYFFTLDAF